MGSENDKKRLDVEVERLSSLPDDLIHKTLSFSDTLDAIKTSTLSSRWRFIWTTMTCLAFSSEDFPNLPKFSKFVKHVLSGHDNQREVSSVKLSFRGKASHVFVKRILDYAFSHNVQQLDITCLVDSVNIMFPLSLLSSQTLKHLFLKHAYRRPKGSVTLTSIELISKCVNLKNLTLTRCEMVGSDNTDFSIFHPQLSNLTIERKADISINEQYWEDPQNIVGLFTLLQSVKDLTLNLEILEHLSSSVEIISHQHSPLANLKSIKIHPLLEKWRLPRDTINISTEVKNYLLDSSPGATFTMVSREDIIAERNATYAKNCMAELRVLLEQEKADMETNRAHTEQENVPMESHNAKMDEEQNALDENVGHINSCWESLNEQIKEGKEKMDYIVRQLRFIRELLTKLPASKRAEMQPCYSSFCAQAESVMCKKRDCMKIQLDENQSRLNVCFHELATTLQSSL
ncbi:F-box domain, Leucine-rich repeat domain, L domain-like protein [Artemisia annua]|uniref:F-box domain, Leucine-rich repeat domain, L domain-like protein n=1 Tax=Artemisia annua TaxID=35608 RepID=A0A2U1P7R8_ARTAN|nr:F-box domain, Leucine-rich repeat domain, L domain-like protein [Artemisia annua]